MNIYSKINELNNITLEESITLIEAGYEVQTKKEEKPKIEIKHPGEFKDWCKKEKLLDDDDKITCECICKALESNDPVLHKRANFAYNFGFKRNDKTCDCVEKLRKGNEEASIVEGNEGFVTDAFNKIDELIYKGLIGLRDMLMYSRIIANGEYLYKTKTENIKQLMRYRVKIKRVINSGIDLNVILNKYTPVMMGLSVQLEDMYEILSKTVDDTKDITSTLDTVKNKIESILNSNPDKIKNTLPTRTEIASIERHVNNLHSLLSKISDDKVLTDKKLVKNVVKRLSTFPTLVEESLKLGNVFKIELLESIEEELNNLIEDVNSLIESLDPKLIDKKDLINLATYIKVVANYVTEVSFVYYAYNQLLLMEIAICKIINDEDPSPILGTIKDTTNKIMENIKSVF